jgi:hypothetical protein
VVFDEGPSIRASLDLLGVLPGVRDAQDAAAGLPANDNAGPVDEGHREDHVHRRLKVAQASLRPGHR